MRWVAAFLVCFVGLSAHAQAAAFEPAVARLVDTVMVPAYARFAQETAAQRERVAGLCEDPSPTRLLEARNGLRPVVTSFAAIEPYRFGPARVANRYERLFFWPDRRGRALRQVQRLLAEEDPTAVDATTLTSKSVAVQGLPALEFALFGSGSNQLAQHSTYRCAYAVAVATAISEVAAQMAEEWRTSFSQTMKDAGPDNPVYRTHAEAFQDIIQAAATQLELSGVQKLASVIGSAPESAKPKRAPFWRSNLSLPMVSANVAAVRAVLNGGVTDVLESNTLVRSTLFELDQVDRALAPLLSDGAPFSSLMSDPEAHRRLAFAVIPLASAERLVSERIQGALGLAVGFNALDGD